jgi:hypothetical protein
VRRQRRVRGPFKTLSHHDHAWHAVKMVVRAR